MDGVLLPGAEGSAYLGWHAVTSPPKDGGLRLRQWRAETAVIAGEPKGPARASMPAGSGHCRSAIERAGAAAGGWGPRARRYPQSAGSGHPAAVRIHREARDNRALLGGEREADRAISGRCHLDHLPGVVAAP
jgi:hypothetical protein